MHGLDHWLFVAGVLAIFATFVAWWRDVIGESNTPGVHTVAVQKGLKIRVGLFIVSEVMFFVAFFWGVLS